MKRCEFSVCQKWNSCGYYCRNHHKLICIAGFQYSKVRTIEEEAKKFSDMFGISYDLCFEKFVDLFVESTTGKK